MDANRFPNEILLLVFSFSTPAFVLSSLCLVSRRFHQLSLVPALWQGFCLQRLERDYASWRRSVEHAEQRRFAQRMRAANITGRGVPPGVEAPMAASASALRAEFSRLQSAAAARRLRLPALLRRLVAGAPLLDLWDRVEPLLECPNFFRLPPAALRRFHRGFLWFFRARSVRVPLALGVQSPPAAAAVGWRLYREPRFDAFGLGSAAAAAPPMASDSDSDDFDFRPNEAHLAAFADRYCGDIVGGVRSGVGCRFFDPTSAYIGEWHEGLREGFGAYYGGADGTYLGDWRSNEPHGDGVFFWGPEDVYAGEWRRGERDGRGARIWPGGDAYVGEWRRGARCGRGVYLWPNGLRYEGGWENGRQHGEGRLEWLDGRTFQGSFRNGKKAGLGEFDFGNGARWRGWWEEGRRNGPGVLEAADGRRWEGEWREDALVARDPANPPPMDEYFLLHTTKNDEWQRLFGQAIEENRQRKLQEMVRNDSIPFWLQAGGK